MQEVYTVNVCVDDTMQGIPYILGIFSDENIARRVALNFINDSEYEIVDGNYLVSDARKDMQYSVKIVKCEIDKVNYTISQFLYL